MKNAVQEEALIDLKLLHVTGVGSEKTECVPFEGEDLAMPILAQRVGVRQSEE